ncbi:24856_t:CDS:2, partial [Gigaspora rosea]
MLTKSQLLCKQKDLVIDLFTVLAGNFGRNIVLADIAPLVLGQGSRGEEPINDIIIP